MVVCVGSRFSTGELLELTKSLPTHEMGRARQERREWEHPNFTPLYALH